MSLLLPLVMHGLITSAQLYFPPVDSDDWETLDPEELGWCAERIDSLYQFLDSNNTNAFVLLVNGKIVLERYFDDHTMSSNWYWASAGKTLTSAVVGIAQQEGHLEIEEPTSYYLGEGWTDCEPEQEQQITIRHQLTMTSGLSDGVSDPYCTLDTCLQFAASAGTRWAYHNAPYTLLDNVVESATGQTLNNYAFSNLTNRIGMNGFFVPQGYNKVYYSTARSMARFGLLILGKGAWNGVPILNDSVYYHDMVTTSQELNKSYGYLWWLNGRESFMAPGSQIVWPGSLSPDAPEDMFAALGKNGQFINVVPSSNMVWIRMGNAPSTTLVPFFLNNDIWKFINTFECTTTGTKPVHDNRFKIVLYPNPANDYLHILSRQDLAGAPFTLFNSNGLVLQSGNFEGPIHVAKLPSGMYYLSITYNQKQLTRRFVKI